MLFNETIGDKIEVGDTIYVTGSSGDNSEEQTKKDQSAFDLSTLEEISDSPADQLTSSAKERLDSILYNLISLQFFNEFCLQEFSVENVLFWIEAQIFRSIQEPVKVTCFANYIYLTYLHEKAPLKVNVEKDITDDIVYPFTDTPKDSLFAEAQHSVYTTIQGHAYSRYEKSDLFAKFLEYKKDDPYTYMQAVVAWNESLVEHNYNDIYEFVSIMSADTSSLTDTTHYDSMAFRQRILSDIYSRYFPIVSPVIQGYFDQLGRGEFEKKQTKVGKEKKLTKFFGERPTTDAMKSQKSKGITYSQSTSTVSYMVTESIQVLDSGDDHPSEDATIRKKAGKLGDFFGNAVTRSQMKTQALSLTDLTKTEGVKEAPAVVGFVSNKNDLSESDRRELTKRARKLLLLLGETLDETTISTHLKAAMKVSPSTNMLQISPTKTASGGAHSPSEGSTAEIDTRAIQKQRLDKLSNFLGHRIAESDITVASKSTPTGRPLTSGEKIIFKKRSDKLESILGSAVPSQNIVKYQDEDLFSDEFFDTPAADGLSTVQMATIESGEICNADLMQKQKIMKLKKIRKLLGTDVNVETVLEHQFLDAIAVSLRSTGSISQNNIDLLREVEDLKRYSVKRATLQVHHGINPILRALSPKMHRK